MEKRQAQAEAAQAQQEQQQMTAMSDAYVKTQKAPEEGSGAEMLSQLMQEEGE